GVDPDDVQTLQSQGFEYGSFIATSGFQQDPFDLKLVQACDQLRKALRVIPDLELGNTFRKKAHIQSRFRNVETNEVGNHRQALLHSRSESTLT
ncbi:hypothetical protein PPS11_37015, partial [Pseudomonas putida S11]